MGVTGMPSSESPVSNQQNVLLFFHIPSDTRLRKSFETGDIHLHFMLQLITQGHGYLPLLCSITGAESSIETDDILRLFGSFFLGNTFEVLEHLPVDGCEYGKHLPHG